MRAEATRVALPAVREEAPDDEVERWLAADDRPAVDVSLGSFLSVRADVLSRAVAALSGLGARVALASGSTRRSDLGSVPTGWLVRPELPQVRLLERALGAATASTSGGCRSSSLRHHS